MKKWLIWLGVAISLFFLYISVKNLQVADVWRGLRTANYWWLIPGVAIYLLGVVPARTWRWHYMLRPIKRVSLRSLFPVLVIGYMGNNVYPARIGELIRAYLLRRKEGVSFSASLAIITVERIFDGVVMFVFIFATLPFAPLPGAFHTVIIFTGAAFLAALAAFFALAIWPNQSRALYNKAIDRWLPERWQDKVRVVLDNFMDGLHCLRRPGDVFMVFFTSLVIWLTETVKYWFVMHAFHFQVDFTVLMLMAAVGNLATTIPSAPGYVGTFDKTCIEVLKSFGVLEPLALAYTVVLHAALWLPITLLGFLFMWTERVSWADFGAAAASRQETTPAK